MAAKFAFRSRGDWRLEDSEPGPRIVIPTRPIWLVAAFMGFWLMGWTAGEASALKTLFGPGTWASKSFIAFWLCGWTVGGVFAWAIFLATSGLVREVVSRDGPDLCVRWSVFGLGWTFRYAVAAMGPLCAPEPAPREKASGPGSGLVVADDDEPLRPRALGEASGSSFRAGGESKGVRFSYAGKEASVGKGLDEGQAARLAETMALRLGLRLADGSSGV